VTYELWLILQQPGKERYLVKHSLVVEKVGDSRKLRLLFLFNDVLVCAGQKKSHKCDNNTFTNLLNDLIYAFGDWFIYLFTQLFSVWHLLFNQS